MSQPWGVRMALDNDTQAMRVARRSLNQSALTRLNLEAYLGYFVEVCIADTVQIPNSGCTRGWIVGVDHDTIVLVSFDEDQPSIGTHHAIQGLRATTRTPTTLELARAVIHVPELVALWSLRGVI